MIQLISLVIFSIIIIMEILVTCGLPLGEFTMGGKYKVLPKKMRAISAFSILIQLFAIVVLLQAGAFITPILPNQVAKISCFCYAVLLSLNTIMNAISPSKKEKYVMTPLALIVSICFWITAFYL